jgi:hypothetical protein
MLNDCTYYDERGVNSNQILSWLHFAYALTNSQKFLQSFNNLTVNFQVQQQNLQNYLT